jgi:hypothetical protein
MVDLGLYSFPKRGRKGISLESRSYRLLEDRLSIIGGKTVKRLTAALALVLLLVPGAALAQKIGILPFDDASGAGARLGELVAKQIRAEFLKDQKLTPKLIQYKHTNEEELATIDAEQAVGLGKKNGVEYMLIGTILEAESSSSSSGRGGFSILGQSVGSSVRTVKATITLQGELVSVTQAKSIGTFRVNGTKTDRSVGGDVSTPWTSMGTDTSTDSSAPTMKALRDAVEKLVKEVSRKL